MKLPSPSFHLLLMRLAENETNLSFLCRMKVLRVSTSQKHKSKELIKWYKIDSNFKQSNRSFGSTCNCNRSEMDYSMSRCQTRLFYIFCFVGVERLVFIENNEENRVIHGRFRETSALSSRFDSTRIKKMTL